MADNYYKQNRINEEIRRELSLILREVKDPRIPSLVTVSSAKVSIDLKYAKIYVSWLGDDAEKDVLKGLRAASGFLRKRLGERLNLRSVPELTFEVDHSIQTGARIDQLLKQIKQEEEES